MAPAAAFAALSRFPSDSGAGGWACATGDVVEPNPPAPPATTAATGSAGNGAAGRPAPAGENAPVTRERRAAVAHHRDRRDDRRRRLVGRRDRRQRRFDQHRRDGGLGTGAAAAPERADAAARPGRRGRRGAAGGAAARPERAAARRSRAAAAERRAGAAARPGAAAPAGGRGGTTGGRGGTTGSGGGASSNLCNWPTANGSQSVSSTINVSGTYDGGMKRFTGSGSLGGGGQTEGQPPMFQIANGGTLTERDHRQPGRGRRSLQRLVHAEERLVGRRRRGRGHAAGLVVEPDR